MACFKPIGCRFGADGRATFGDKARGREGAVPCGKCIGCKLERSRQWAMRCMHEAKMHKENSWFTLTYDKKNLPYASSLVPEHLSLFMKRLRKKVDGQIRFYGCGEYGEDKGRPHYHVCLFGYDFRDKYVWRLSDSGADIYRSDELQRIWGMGLTELGELTFESAAYTARYCTKVISGEMKQEHYTRILLDGRMVEIEPEFGVMSKGTRKDGLGGIGKGFYEEYKRDIYPADECIVRGVRSKPPRYYDKCLEEEAVSMYEGVKAKRRDFAERNKEDETIERRFSKEKVKIAQVSQLIRGYEKR